MRPGFHQALCVFADIRGRPIPRETERVSQSRSALATTASLCGRRYWGAPDLPCDRGRASKYPTWCVGVLVRVCEAVEKLRAVTRRGAVRRLGEAAWPRASPGARVGCRVTVASSHSLRFTVCMRTVGQPNPTARPSRAVSARVGRAGNRRSANRTPPRPAPPAARPARPPKRGPPPGKTKRARAAR